MAKDFAEIRQIMEGRRAAQAPVIAKMIEVRNRYNGDYVMPLPMLKNEPVLPPYIPLILQETVDAVAQRAASVMPATFCPSRGNSERAREYASKRRRAIGATWYHCRLPLKMRRMFRHMRAYASTAAVVMPDFREGYPTVQLRDPLATFPEPRAAEDDRAPDDCGFVFSRTGAWLRARYPACRIENGGPIAPARSSQDNDMWNVLEWVDPEVFVVGIIGPSNPYYNYSDRSTQFGGGGFMEVSRVQNRMGMAGVVAPALVTLDRVMSHLWNLVQHSDLMSRLWALDLVAQEMSIFPDKYVIGREGQRPRIEGGRWKDGREGEVNVVVGATDIGVLNNTPDPRVREAIDRLERNMRVSSGLVPQMGGESYGALRTGRGMDSLMEAAVDPRIHEMHEIMQVQLGMLNESIFACYQAYWPDKQFSMFTGKPGDNQTVEFTPRVHFETRENAVAYSVPGADVQGHTIVLGQLFGTRTISQHTFRVKHPWIDDPDEEASRVEEEELERAAFEGIQQQVAAGQLPFTFLAELERQRKNSHDIMEAIEKADTVLRNQQAQAPAPADPTQGQVASPDQMPGLQQGQPGQQTIPAPDQNIQNFAGLLQALGQRG